MRVGFLKWHAHKSDDGFNRVQSSMWYMRLWLHNKRPEALTRAPTFVLCALVEGGSIYIVSASFTVGKVRLDNCFLLGSNVQDDSMDRRLE